MNRKGLLYATLIFALNVVALQSKAQQIEKWMTTATQKSLLKKESVKQYFSDSKNDLPTITINGNKRFQEIDGFGFTLTGGSAKLINNLATPAKAALLEELFGKAESSIAISYLRISMAASDLSESVFSYDDLPAGETDSALVKFNLSKDTIDVIPLLVEILRINPKIKIIATPWSPPVWMKDNGSSMGGHLLPQFYETYSRYFVRYIGAMQEKGIPVDAITPQNEPLHDGNNPSMVMTADEQGNFIGKYLGPAFRKARITTKIILYDHNCDRPDYPISILKDSTASPFVDGSAFHLYGGDINVLSAIHDQFPSKHLYFTEQWVGSKSKFDEEISWHINNVIIGSMRNWSRVALEWNLANDPGFGPHTPGGCTECMGALTIGKAITRNVAYYIIAHVSKFVPPGSVRIESNIIKSLPNVAFITTSGKKVLLVLNDGSKTMDFSIKDNDRIVVTSLPAGAVATYVW